MPALAADESLELAVTINGYAVGKIGEFVQHGDTLLVDPADLKDLGLKLPTSLNARPDGLVSLSAIDGLRWHVDGPAQDIEITAGSNLLQPTLLQVAPPESDFTRIESGLGATLNYDLAGSAVAGQTVGSGLFDLRAFSPWGVTSTSMLAFAGDDPTGTGNAFVRLDSTYVYSDPQTSRRYRLGDFIDGGLNWTRPVRMGGLQVQSDFSLRPDLVTFPLPTLSGEAAVPSTVDVLVNDSRLLSRQVAPGPFEIPQLPVVTGADTITTTVTNALGEQVTATLPFYASSSLLVPGLESYSAEAGLIRRNWGQISNDYDDLAASLTYRRGLLPNITGEVHAEGTGGQFMAGLGVAANVFNLGVANIAVAGSAAGDHDGGGMIAAGFQRTGQIFSIGVSAVVASKTFGDIAAISGDPMPQRQISANLGLALGRYGSLGLAYTGLDRAKAEIPIDLIGPGRFFVEGITEQDKDAPLSGDVKFFPAQHAHLMSASYSVQVGNLSLYATGFHDLGRDGGSGGMVGITIPLGTRSSASVSGAAGTNAGYAQAQIMQSPTSVGDWGYQAYADTGTPNHDFGQVQYKSAWGQFSGGVDQTGGITTLRGEAQGSLSIADKTMFASNTINDSFAIVDTNGVPDVRVTNENREVGRTDASGTILVPDLRSFDVNHLAIDPTDVPETDMIGYTTRDVRPQDRSGVVVRFPIRPSYAALVRLLDETGRPVPIGSAATLVGRGEAVPVGYEGEVYIENLHPGLNELDVVRPDGHHCSVRFQYQSQPGKVPEIGPLECQAG